VQLPQVAPLGTAQNAPAHWELNAQAMPAACEPACTLHGAGGTLLYQSAQPHAPKASAQAFTVSGVLPVPGAEIELKHAVFSRAVHVVTSPYCTVSVAGSQPCRFAQRDEAIAAQASSAVVPLPESGAGPPELQATTSPSGAIQKRMRRS
jgi:hypothetical protein